MDINTQDLIVYLTIKRRLAPNSIRLVVSRYILFNKWLSQQRSTLCKSAVEAFLYSLRETRKNNTINSYIFMFFHLYSYTRDRGQATDNFIEGLSMLPKKSRPIEILTPIEIRTLLSATAPYGKFRAFSAEEVTSRLNSLYQAFTMFLAHTGARFSEASNLTVQYVDLYSGKATFLDTKNKECRTVWIAEPLIRNLKAFIQNKSPEDFVFTTFLGKQVIPQNYDKYLHRIAKTANIAKRVHPHIFRHSYATQLLMSGVDVTMVATILGHKDIQTTYANYVHLADETIKKSMMRHPLVQQHLKTGDIIRMIKETFTSLRLEQNDRIQYRLLEEANRLQLDVSVKEV